VVTPTGTSESRRLPGSGAGPSPDRLFLGSEGTLGVITEAWMRLQDRPRWQQSVTVDFASFAHAVAATRTIAQSGLHPSNCRLLDPMEALINAGSSTSGGLLVLAFESADHPVGPWLDRAIQIARDHGGRPGKVSAKEPDRAAAAPTTPADAWRSSFLRMPYQRDAVTQRSLIAETFETACTWDRFDELHAAITTAAYQVMAALRRSRVLTCRFTHVYPDGPAPYYGVYASGRWGSRVPMWDQIKTGVSEAIAAHGGTITHHHAVGRDHAPWYDRQRPESSPDDEGKGAHLGGLALDDQGDDRGRPDRDEKDRDEGAVAVRDVGPRNDEEPQELVDHTQEQHQRGGACVGLVPGDLGHARLIRIARANGRSLIRR
jgi:alkyldihydroxyacetonephosphate synthase